ncbi:ABC transporter related protein [Novosphingobium nitrogenifigens DSM 19370]|uniref:ABC transporter related protein n=1 Tax=Novosphingobium nitrogenifigens DSM 19370 TaxID=983920 RepID=F1ZBF8_9SPHN|nr:ABC transporter ATP-binding protein [Novosphingobium nitrogenifigens]EGD58144.1 ABC transporter related protein [Novosphingobium nitrogenifigens DSM 19370]
MLETFDLRVPGRLDGVTTGLAPGSVTAIVGPNGAGKSTLLSALAGLLPGDVRLKGRRLDQTPPRERARRIGYLPQSAEVAWNVSVRTLVGLGRLPHGASADDDAAAVDKALADVDLSRLSERAIGHLSGGERARALLARVLAGNPEWILADEPLASLDIAQVRNLLARFRDLAGAGRGVVLVLHDLAQAMNYADRVLVLHKGHLEADGAPDEALDPGVISRIWGVDARWLGEGHGRALAW